MKARKLLLLPAFCISIIFSSCEEKGELGLIYLDKNGITIKAKDVAVAGDTDILDGVVYTVVDSVLLYEMVDSSLDVTHVVTTLVTNMHNLFRLKHHFNQDLSAWDVSSVENCLYFSLNTSAWTLPKPDFTNCDCGCN